MLGCYNAPSVSQVAAIIPGHGLEKFNRDIVLYCKNEIGDNDYLIDKDGNKKRKQIHINERHPTYDPLQYVTMFPEGTIGWAPNSIFTNDSYHDYINNSDSDFESESDGDIEMTEYISCFDDANPKSNVKNNNSDIHLDSDDDIEMIDINDNPESDDCTCNHNKCKCNQDNNNKHTKQKRTQPKIKRKTQNKKKCKNKQKITKNKQKLEGKSQKQKKQSKNNDSKSKKHKFVNCRKYYRYRAMTRNNSFNPLHRYGKLWQQYVVDNWAKIESNDLNYIERNQKTIRMAYADGLEEAIENDDVESVGKPTVLPASFPGSPRWFHSKFQDAMAIVQYFKKPDLFITFTCNPQWKEIQENLFDNQTPYDRPELVARVFNLKKDELLNDIVTKGVFGRTVANVQVVEFQKRGLPHIHILIILSKEDSFKTVEEYDQIVSAEIPDHFTSPRLYECVMKNMIHFHTELCWNDNFCKKYFPKDYCPKTTVEHDGYPMYKRRAPDQVCIFLFLLLQIIYIFVINRVVSKLQLSEGTKSMLLPMLS